MIIGMVARLVDLGMLLCECSGSFCTDLAPTLCPRQESSRMKRERRSVVFDARRPLCSVTIAEAMDAESGCRAVVIMRQEKLLSLSGVRDALAGVLGRNFRTES